ncbi:K02A2.6-like [Cordylochernes scorpioides]|uniref:K02A2.6-like n=1 Tax=Cordylochernes scorpioides TaxID=51811 RepID=A0ABY6KCF9_9ARAC|nr:K02A2.6-like [Cordylochernes scorpioides]
MSNIPVPAPILINSQAAENWRFFKSQWDNYQVATELNKKDNNVIRATFLSLIGKDCFNVFLNLDLKEDEKNSLPKIIEALDNHFTPQKNVIYERYIFNTSNQEENEGIDSYTNRLRGLASSCEYDILTEELIRDRIVLGIKDNRVRKKLLMEPKLNLSSAIDICRTAEVTEQQITKLTGQESEDVKWNRKYERKKEATKATNETFEDIINCRYCGSKHRKASCPAYANQTVPLECQLDSGSTCNIMSLDDYRWVMQERSNNLDISNARLENFGGVILKPIVNINQKPLLSAKTIEDLNLVTKHDAVYHLANSSCSRAESIINKYEDVFKGLGMLPKEYHIEIEKEATPVQQHPRRIPIGLKAEFKRKLDDLEGRGIIERVQKSSSWISNLVLVKKQNKLRVCLDPRDLNKVIKRPHFQIPTIDEILPSLNNAKIFTVIDAKDGFWQVKLDSQSSDLTTFWTPFGRYKWLRMPFGISAAPEEFQRRLHEVIEGLEGVEVIADDILVFGKGNTTEDAIRDHNIKLEQLLKRARERNLKFNKDKIRLCSNHVNYMGHILSDEGLRPDPGKVEAIKAMSRPQNILHVDNETTICSRAPGGAPAPTARFTFWFSVNLILLIIAYTPEVTYLWLIYANREFQGVRWRQEEPWEAVEVLFVLLTAAKEDPGCLVYRGAACGGVPQYSGEPPTSGVFRASRRGTGDLEASDVPVPGVFFVLLPRRQEEHHPLRLGGAESGGGCVAWSPAACGPRELTCPRYFDSKKTLAARPTVELPVEECPETPGSRRHRESSGLLAGARGTWRLLMSRFLGSSSCSCHVESSSWDLALLQLPGNAIFQSFSTSSLRLL